MESCLHLLVEYSSGLATCNFYCLLFIKDLFYHLILFLAWSYFPSSIFCTSACPESSLYTFERMGPPKQMIGYLSVCARVRSSFYFSLAALGWGWGNYWTFLAFGYTIIAWVLKKIGAHLMPLGVMDVVSHI